VVRVGTAVVEFEVGAGLWVVVCKRLWLLSRML
jgi:hypothetical protein